MSGQEWMARLSDEFAVVEAAGDRVARASLRPDVYEAIEANQGTPIDGLWGTKFVSDPVQKQPILVYGENRGREAFVSVAQTRWLAATYASLVEQGATVTSIVVESVGQDGVPFKLTGEWSEKG